MGSDTNIPVSDAVWSELHRRKERGQSFDDVLREELEMARGSSDAAKQN